jgi:hypothetical protein
MWFVHGFIGFVIGVIVASPTAIVLYWYFSIHRGKTPVIPADFKK